MCEQNDAKLRQIFQHHLNSVRVKIERIDEHNEYDAVRPLEEHWVDDAIPEAFGDCSPKSASENGDDWAIPMQNTEDSDTNDSTSGLNELHRSEVMKKNLKTENEAGHDADDKVKNEKCENGRLKCEICNLSFLNSKTLTNHFACQSHLDRINQLHEGDGCYICEICNNSYADRSALKLHIRVHLSQNLEHCPFCDRTFSRSSYLKTHIETQHAKAFPCPDCDLRFDAKRALRRHQFDTHRPPKPEKRYICEICSRVFNRINNLNQHRVTHSGEKNFSCDICQRKVSTKQVLK